MLDDRKAAILTAVVEVYIETAQPVGSNAVVASIPIKTSSATVRNEMAALESEGYLVQPHTSAGRVPTERGYRHFVDAMALGRGGLPEPREVRTFFRDMQGEIEHLLKDTAALLSRLTDYAAVVVDTSTDAATIRSFQLVTLAPRLVLVVLVLSNGAVEKRTLEFDSDVEPDLLEQVRDLLGPAVEGWPPARIQPPASSGRPDVDVTAQAVHTAIVSGQDSERVYVDGTSRVVNSFDAVESVREVLTVLEQQLVVVNLLTDVVDRGLNVAIGTETGAEALGDCSLVVAPYEIEGERAGSIAVLGPTRMHYPQAMAAVAAVSRRLGRRLSEG